jgi:hypothetical protein
LLFPQVLGRAIPWTEWHRSERQIPPVATLVPGLPRDLAGALDRLLRKRPEERYPSAVEALESIRPAPHGYRRWGGPALVAGGCVAAVVLAVLLVMRPWETGADAQVPANVQLVRDLTKERDEAVVAERLTKAAMFDARNHAITAQEAVKKLRVELEKERRVSDVFRAVRDLLEQQLAAAQAEIRRLTPPTRRLRHLW